MIKKGRGGQFRFSLVGRNGQIVVISETYTTKASCKNGIKAVRTLAADADIEDQTTRAGAADQQAKVKAETRTAAKAAKKVIKEAAPDRKRQDGDEAAADVVGHGAADSPVAPAVHLPHRAGPAPAC